MSKKGYYTMSSHDPVNATIRAGSIAPPLGSKMVNGAPNRNLNSQQFKAAHSYEQQRMF